MKAITYSNYGGPEVLQLEELTKPIPSDNEILIKVHSTSVTAGDSRMRSFNVPASVWIFARLYLGPFKPRNPVLGMELSGVVESIGKNVTKFKVGDQVFASTLNSGFGAYAEYKCMSENAAVSLKPLNLNHSEAAVIPIGAGTALRFLRKAQLNSSKNILIFGASGSVGTYALQLAKYYGADVTAVCSTRTAAFVSTLNPNLVIDYTKKEIDTWGRYDVVLDAVGKLKSKHFKSLLKTDGKILSVIGNPGKIVAADLDEIKHLVETNNLRPIVSDSYKLENVAEAHDIVDRGLKIGNVSVVVSC